MQLSVDNRLLTQLPHFFQSFPESLTEVVQNSYRGGAQHLDFHWNSSTRILTITDDGHGIANPTDLFTAGRSGWDSSVVEPAGLGFFALLGLCQSLTIINHHALSSWQVQLTPQSLEGTEFAITTLPLYWKTGVILKAVLPQDIDVSKVITDTAWRQFYPLTVTWASNDENPYTIPGQDQLSNSYSLAVASGTLYPKVTQKISSYPPTLIPIWEHRLMSQTNAYTQLIKALIQLPHGEIIAQFLPEHITWMLPSNTAVRPKLPDRREVIDNQAWHQAIHQLAQDLATQFSFDTVQHFYQHHPTLTLPEALRVNRFNSLNRQSWPDAETFLQQTQDFYAWHPFWRVTSRNFPLVLGYQMETIPNPEDFDYDEDEDFPESQCSFWFRTPLHLASSSAVMNCIRNNIPALYDSHAAPLTIEVEQCEPIPDLPHDALWFDMARATSITLKQNGRILAHMPEWIQSSEEVHAYQNARQDQSIIDHEPSSTSNALWIIQGTPQDILESISFESVPWIPLALADPKYFSPWEYIEGDDNAHFLDFHSAFIDLRQMLLTTWNPSEIAQQQRQATLQNVATDYHLIIQTLNDLETLARQNASPLTDDERHAVLEWTQSLLTASTQQHPAASWIHTFPN